MIHARLCLGDITTFSGDALLNAANPQMLGGGGVDGAIHRAAGPLLRERCLGVPGTEAPHVPGTPGEAEIGVAYMACQHIRCPVGQVRPVPATGTGLHVDWVLNTVGPILQGLQRAGAGRTGEKVVKTEHEAFETLTEGYRAAFELAHLLGITTLAVPAVSTGIYGVPHFTCADACFAAFVEDDTPQRLALTVYLHGLGDLAAWRQAAEGRGVTLILTTASEEGEDEGVIDDLWQPDRPQ